MTDLDTNEIHGAIAELKRAGYTVQRTPGPRHREASYAFTLTHPGCAQSLVGPARASAFAAWASALEHAQQHDVPVQPYKLAPFYSAELPESSLDPEAIAKRFGVDLDTARRQASVLRQHTVFLSETHQVNVQMLKAPFGPDLGDVAWLSIKRRDRDVIRDWRELQAIKNAVIGPEHEGFELYPAESRLCDAANQFHLFVFMQARVRLPVGFTVREVAGAAAAEAVGATQRELPETA